MQSTNRYLPSAPPGPKYRPMTPRAWPSCYRDAPAVKFVDMCSIRYQSLTFCVWAYDYSTSCAIQSGHDQFDCYSLTKRNRGIGLTILPEGDRNIAEVARICPIDTFPIPSPNRTGSKLTRNPTALRFLRFSKGWIAPQQRLEPHPDSTPSLFCFRLWGRAK